MKKDHEHFLKECLGEAAIESLNKAIVRQGLDGPTGLEDTYMSLMVVPRSLLSWVSNTVRGMDDGDKLEVMVPGSKGAKILVNKFKNDIYSGYMHKDGEIIHRFSDVSIPALSSHLMTVLELYDDFKDVHQDSSTIINDLVPLIDKMVAERMKSVAQPTVNVTINNGKNEEGQPNMAQSSIPVIKDESNYSDSYQAGYHMVMGNYHRGKEEKDKASSHDRKLDGYIKGKYSGINKEEFDAGIKSAACKIKKDSWEDCGCEEHGDQYDDEREKLIDEAQQEEAQDDKEKSVRKDQDSASPSPSNPPPTPSAPTPPKSPKGFIPSSSKETPESGGKDMTKAQWEMTKSEMDSRCPDCGGKEFSNEQFIGCICMSPMRTSALKVIKNEKGNFEIKFGRGWDTENIETLLEILKKRNKNG